MDPYAIDPNYDPNAQHDSGLSAHYARLAAAESRLAQFRDGEFLFAVYKHAPGTGLGAVLDAMRADLRLILSELNGLKQFDPR